MTVKELFMATDREELFSEAKDKVLSYVMDEELFFFFFYEIASVDTMNFGEKLVVGTTLYGDGRTKPELKLKEGWGSENSLSMCAWGSILSCTIEPECFELHKGAKLPAEILAEMLEHGIQQYEHDCEIERIMEEDDMD